MSETQLPAEQTRQVAVMTDSVEQFCCATAVTVHGASVVTALLVPQPTQ